MTTLVLVNPTAGGGRAGREADAVLARLPGELDIRRTVGPGHATALVKAARERGVQRFISVGGDGTLHEVVSGAVAVGEGRPWVGFLPLGTGNSFGRDVGVLTLEDAVGAVCGDGCRVVDAVRLDADGREPLYSINIVGLGFSALAGDLMNRRFKRFGALGYIMAVLVELARLHAPRVRYRLDGGDWREEDLVMLSLCNSQFTGGAMHMAPNAVVDDGLLDLVALHPMTRRRFLGAFPRIFRGTHTALDEITTDRARRVDLDVDGPVDVMIDGEVLKLVLRSVEVVPGALEVACPTT
ncbi:MAG: diacylglycerol kinase family lipid kinase [Alphaproteobacteria bacterium]|nr:diacylglycerol kinase family lipid kinase [Alphaproteobacteria bacterium]